MEIREFKKGDVIFNQGDAADSMYDVVSGKVGIYVEYGTDAENMLTELEPGKYFGEMGVIENMPRSATAVAIEDCSLTMVKAEDVGSFFEKNPDKSVEIMKHLSSRLRALTVDYMEACHTLAEIEEIMTAPEVSKAIEKAEKKKNGFGIKKAIMKFAQIYKEYDDTIGKYYQSEHADPSMFMDYFNHYSSY